MSEASEWSTRSRHLYSSTEGLSVAFRGLVVGEVAQSPGQMEVEAKQILAVAAVFPVV